MLLKIFRARMGAVVGTAGTASLLLAGCWAGDPEPLPVAVRADAGVLTILVPMCPRWRVEDALVVPITSDTEPPPAWEGEGFRGRDQEVITLDETSWTKVSGSYDQLARLSVSIETSGASFGADVPNWDEVSHLPKGDFASASGRMMTKEQFERVASTSLHCHQ